MSVLNQKNAPAKISESRIYLTFLFGSQHFAVDILKVKEIIGFDKIDIIAIDAPFFIIGATYLYDSIIPIVNLSCFLNNGQLNEFSINLQLDSVIVFLMANKLVALKINNSPEIIELTESQFFQDGNLSAPYSNSIICSAAFENVTYKIIDIEKLLMDADQYTQVRKKITNE
jgi:purine-binding chemotaxis protein CheW